MTIKNVKNVCVDCVTKKLCNLLKSSEAGTPSWANIKKSPLGNRVQLRSID